MRTLLVLVVCLAALAGGAEAHRSNAADVKLRIYTDWPAPRTFLGCLNCADTDPTSFWNPKSRYGWSNPDGVWSQPALRSLNFRHLVCDLPLRAKPPEVFDEYWGFYYLLTVDAVRRNSICGTNASQRGCAALRALCTGSPTAAVVTRGGWADVVAPPH